MMVYYHGSDCVFKEHRGVHYCIILPTPIIATLYALCSHIHNSGVLIMIK